MKRFITFLIILGSLFISAVPAFAHDNQKEHDKDLKRVLYGSSEKTLRGENKDAFQAIADAAALSIDQFSPNKTAQWKKSEFEDLKTRVGFPYEFSDFDLNHDKAGNNITANTHRAYTHRGWNYASYPDMEFWKDRKKVLIYTANKEMFYSNSSFSWAPWLQEKLFDYEKASEQCDAFCALVYYVHILGDHLEGDTAKKIAVLEPLARTSDLSSPGIIPELEEYLEILFQNQRNTYKFSAMRQEIERIALDAEKNYYSWGGINTDEKARLNQQYAEELMKCLSNYVPVMLQQEQFFDALK